jgi:hypothetical protein
MTDKTKKYIHDLANNFSIIDSNLKRALNHLDVHHPELKDELHRLHKADEYVKKSIQTLIELREHVK